MYWYQQAGLFATAPTYCSLAVGSKDGAAAGTTAYGCHVMFAPGTASPDWDVVAYSGAPGGGGGAAITFAGDLNGTSITQTVVGLQGKGLDAATVGTPTDGYLLSYSASSGKWMGAAPTAAGQVSSNWQSVTAPTNILNRPNIWTDNQAGNLYLTQGCYYNVAGSNWIATQTISSILGVTGAGNLSFYASTGNTVGSPVASLPRPFNIDINGVATFTGAGRSLVITPGSTSPAAHPLITSSTGFIDTTSTIVGYGTYGIQVASPDGSRYLQISCANGADPGISSSTNNVSFNTHTNWRGGFQPTIYNADNTYYLQIQAAGAGNGNFSLVNSNSGGYLRYSGGSWMGSSGSGGLVAYSPDFTRYTQINCANGGNPYYNSGTGVLNCSVAWTVTSDYRLKKNVEAIADALPLVMRLRPVAFNWISHGRDLISNEPIPSDGRRHMGFIAHEVQAVLPDVVVGEKDAVTGDGEIQPQGVTDTELIALLVKAVQELSAKVEALENVAHA
jgi:hypothetical protein